MLELNQLDHVPSTPMPEPAKEDRRRTRHDARRAEIAESAIDYVFEHGLSELSVRPLAAALGISHRTLLYHFGSKEALIVRVLHELRARERLLMALEAHSPDGGAARVLRWTWDHFAAPEHQSFFRLFFEVWGNALQHPDKFSEFLDDVIDGWLPIFEAVLTRSGCPEERARDLARLFIAGFRGLYLDLLTTGDRERVERAFDLLVEATTTHCRQGG